MMLTLFNLNAEATEQVPGLYYQSDHISPEQEQTLLDEIDQLPWRQDLKRRVQHYGYRYDYKARAVTADAWLGPLPAWLTPFAQGLAQNQGFNPEPDQVIVNEYLPGQGISRHVDCVPCFGPKIAIISLAAPITMILSHPGTGGRLEIWLEPRSLLLLAEDARFTWAHEIPARRSDRIGGTTVLRRRRLSVTFRRVIRSAG
jgi:alkylated DNA repair dioxygenase AlkB